MAIGGGGGGASGSNLSILLQSQRGPCGGSSQPLEAFLLAGSCSSSVLGSRSMVSFEDVHQVNGSTRPFFRSFDHDDNCDDEFDEYFHQPEKKRRLTVDQIQFLEKSFEVESKLEHERKIQLAKDLGLQPRQVAIWFQNRRARWKTKQLEKDYDALQSTYNSLKVDYDNLLKEKEKLNAEVNLLTDKLLLKEKEKGNSELSDKDASSQELPIKAIADSTSVVGVSNSKVSMEVCKQEDIRSAKSDIFDSDSPPDGDCVHSSLLEAGDSSYIFEPDQLDWSQDEEDNLSKNLLPPYAFPKLEDADNADPASFEDHAFWSWSYQVWS